MTLEANARHMPLPRMLLYSAGSVGTGAFCP